MKSILFVCTGNICRSPTAEGVLRHRLNEAGLSHIRVASAGTHGYHVGEAPDVRTIEHARRRGFNLKELRAQQVTRNDFYEYDLILALDSGHLRELKRLRPENATAILALFLEYAGLDDHDVPDPYYGGQSDFERVLDLVEAGTTGLITKLNDAHNRKTET